MAPMMKSSAALPMSSVWPNRAGCVSCSGFPDQVQAENGRHDQQDQADDDRALLGDAPGRYAGTGAS
jgi:hypothetical protein